MENSDHVPALPGGGTLRRRWRLGAALIAALVVTLPAFAQEGTEPVRFEGRVLFRVGPAGETAADARARRIEQRLDTVLERPALIGSAEIGLAGPEGEQRTIEIGGAAIVTVTPEDAEEEVMPVDALARQWAAVLDRALENTRLRHRSAWVRFAAQVQASVRGAFSSLSESAIRVVPGALAAVLVIGLFWLIAKLVSAVSRWTACQLVRDVTVRHLIKQLSYYSVWLIGIFVAAGAIGFEPQSVVTGLGLTSLALGFALKDILSNFVSGLLILFIRPFEINDQIAIGETEGSVERIDLRATHIRTYDGRLSLVPNADLFTSRIINNTASPRRRGAVEVYAGYQPDVGRLVQVLQEAAAASPGVLADPAPSVLVTQLDRSDLALQVRFWTDSRRSDFVSTASIVRVEIVAALKAAGLPLPEPNVRVLVPGAPEAWRDVLRGPGDARQVP